MFTPKLPGILYQPLYVFEQRPEKPDTLSGVELVHSNFSRKCAFQIFWHLKWSMYPIATAQDNVQCRINSLGQGQSSKNVKNVGSSVQLTHYLADNMRHLLCVRQQEYLRAWTFWCHFFWRVWCIICSLQIVHPTVPNSDSGFRWNKGPSRANRPTSKMCLVNLLLLVLVNLF